MGSHEEDEASRTVKIVLFDFDGTLLRGNSWHLFYRWMLRRHPARAPWLVCVLALRRVRLVSGRYLQEQTLALLCGWTEREVSALGQELYDSEIAPRLRPAALEVLRNCVPAGAEAVLLTGAFDFIAKPFAEKHGIARWRATRLKFVDGKFSGSIDGPCMTGEEKRKALEEMAAEGAFDLTASTAYGDEPVDFAAMKLVGDPVFVSSRKFRSFKVPAGFRVVDWGS